MKSKNQQCSTAKKDAENRNVKIKNRNIKKGRRRNAKKYLHENEENLQVILIPKSR
jgi:hypothetical protein